MSGTLLLPSGWRLVLASGSPRRKEILQEAGIAFEVALSTVDESLHDGEPSDQFVRRVAQEKALDVFARLAKRRNTAVLGADTAVVIDGLVLGKPVDDADAQNMLRLLSGREHRVLTGVCLCSALSASESPARIDTRLASTAVRFRKLNAEEISEYVASGEPFDKAGAYAIQGRASQFVTAIEGEYLNVVGLPLTLVRRMLNDLVIENLPAG
jgi:septum formation protein